MKNQFSIRTIVALTTVASIAAVAVIWWRADYDSISAYQDPGQWPPTVRDTVEELTGFQSGMSIEQFGSKLHEHGSSESSNPEHHKNFEYYWSIDRRNQEPNYIIAGTFFPIGDQEFGLKFATINVVGESYGRWTTVWSIEYASNKIKNLHDIKIRGMSEKQTSDVANNKRMNRSAVTP